MFQSTRKKSSEESQYRNNTEKNQQAQNSQDIPQQSDIQISNTAAEIASIGKMDASKTYQGKIQKCNLSRTKSSNSTVQDFTPKFAEKNSHIDGSSTNQDVSAKKNRY